MSRPLENVAADALNLPPEARAELAHRLIESLDGEDEDADLSPAEIEKAWEEEIRVRLEDCRTGRVETIPAEEVFAQVRRYYE